MNRMTRRIVSCFRCSSLHHLPTPPQKLIHKNVHLLDHKKNTVSTPLLSCSAADTMNPNDSTPDLDQPHIRDWDPDSESEGSPSLASESDSDDLCEANTASRTSGEESEGGDVQADTDPATSSERKPHRPH